MRVAYRFLVWKPERKRSFANHRRRWEGNIKTDQQVLGWVGVEWIDLAQGKDR